MYLYVALKPGGGSGASSGGFTYFLIFGGSGMCSGNFLIVPSYPLLPGLPGKNGFPSWISSLTASFFGGRIFDSSSLVLSSLPNTSLMVLKVSVCLALLENGFS